MTHKTQTSHKANEPKPRQPNPDGCLPAALAALEDAIHALTSPQPHQLDNHTVWLDSRYRQLRDAITSQRHGHKHTQLSSILPFWVDAMKLSIEIHTTLHRWHLHHPDDLQRILHHRWRPQDSKHIHTNITAPITAWCNAIDDLFADKPIYIRDPHQHWRWAACPQCSQTHTHRKTDDGDIVNTPALAVTADRGAVCQACHATWKPDRLLFLGRLLGYRPEGISV